MKYLVTSDIHLGHKSTPTKHIIKSFTSAILTPVNKDIDILFIAGDLFDHLLYLNTIEAQLIVQFFHTLLNYCYANSIQLRILEGTPSHDWYQSNILTKMNEARTNKVDLIYHRQLDIEHNTLHNLYILYIPDEWCHSQEELHAQITLKLKEHSITQVDIAILHGAFKYQAQHHPTTAFLYDEAYFLKLTRRHIHIGHYHIYSMLDRIIANGSLDRLSHGEEAPKGYLLVDNHTPHFIENPYACVYKTLHIKKDTTLQQLHKHIIKQPHGSNIRISTMPSHDFKLAYKELTLNYPDYYFKYHTKKSASEQNSTPYINEVTPFEYTPNTLTDANIYQTLLTSIQAKHALSTTETIKLNNYLKVFHCEQSLSI